MWQRLRHQPKSIFLAAIMAIPCQKRLEELETQTRNLTEGLFFEVATKIFQETTALNAETSPEKSTCLERLQKLKSEIGSKSLDLADKPDYWVVKGRILADLGQKNEAQKAFTRALELFPTHLKGNFHLTRLLVSGSPEKEKHLRRVLVEKPKDYEENDLLKKSLVDLVNEFNLDSSESLAFIEKALALDPLQKDLWQKKAEIALKAKDGNKLLESIGRLNEDVRNYFTGKAHQVLGQNSLAEEAFRSYLMQPGSLKKEWEVDTRLWLAGWYIEQKLFGTARPLLEESLEKFPGESKFADLHGECFRRGPLDATDPEGDLRRALFKNPNSPVIVKALIDFGLKGSELDLVNPTFPEKNKMTQAEGLIRRFEIINRDNRESSWEIEIWKVSLLWHKKLFTRASNLWEDLGTRLNQDSKVTPQVWMKYYVAGARIFRSRGRFTEAKVLLTDGLKKIKDPELQNVIKQFL